MGSFAKCHTLRHIVRLRQMLRRWRHRACAAKLTPPRDVPAGHLAVCVGTRSKRFVIRTAYLNHPAFRKLLTEAEEEFGFDRPGPLTIPCDEGTFEEVLRVLAGEGSGRGCSRGVWGDALPLLRGFDEKSSVW